MLLAQIREKVLSHIPDDQWALVESEVDKAGGVREVSGFAATLLHDAITKASFGGNRSDAGRYAAQQRWKDHVKGGGKGGKSGRGTKYPGVTTVVSDETFSGLPKLPPRTPEQTARIKANVKILQSRRKDADSFDEDKFRGKDALRDLENNPTYKAGVAAKKSEIKRGDDGVARFRGTTLDRAREQLKTEEDSLELFESGKATSRRILGSRFNKTETRAILQARIASARATVQALEEFEDETSPGFFSS